MLKYSKSSLFLLFFYLSFIFSVSGHQQDLLEEKDISVIMKQILSEHLGSKEITDKVLENALTIYINQFDPQKIYLMESEILPYTSESSGEMQEVIQQYKNGNYAIFKKLNGVIQSSIERARKIRQELETDQKHDLFSEKSLSKSPATSEKNSEKFAANIDELKEHILWDIRSYIESQKKRVGGELTLEKKEKILRSYEVKLRDFENLYLYQNDKGQPLPVAEQNNLFAIHVLKALANSLDAHTSFYKANEAYDLRVRLQKEFKGIGLVLKSTTQGPVIAHILPDGPAAKNSQIEVNDILLEIDGKNIEDQSFEKVISLLHGDKNSFVKLTFKRPGKEGEAEKKYSVELPLEKIVLKGDRVDVSSQAFGNGIIGIIKLHSFYQGEGISSEKDIKEAIEKLESQGDLKGLILDLRDNTGGFLSQAVAVAGLFITDGVIVISKYSNGEQRFYRDIDSRGTFDRPLIILTSKMTASAAEIVAAALQDYGVAIVVGDEHTYGKGTIQTQTLTDNQSSSYFKVTVGKYYTVSGNTPEKKGVKADILVPGPWNSQNIGEVKGDNKEIDMISPAYDDQLADVPLELKPWYLKYYIPHLQRQVATWKNMVPLLKKNSEYRIAHNKNYQYFLKGKVGEEEEGEDEELNLLNQNKNYGVEDLQVEEAINILKDMILLDAKIKHR